MTNTIVHHGITVDQITMPAGNPFQASCLCGWSSPVVASRPQATAAGNGHVGEVAEPTRASHCSCGRPAREVLDGGQFGPTGYCGAPAQPLQPCDCGEGAEQHSTNVCHVYGRGMAAETVRAADYNPDMTNTEQTGAPRMDKDVADGYPAVIAYAGVDEAELRDAIAEGSLDADVDHPVISYRTLEQWLRARVVERLLADPKFFDPQATRASRCDCGATAKKVLNSSEFGPTGYCGSGPEHSIPIDCAPWCEYGDGHADAACREDQFCYSRPSVVTLSTEPAQEESLTLDSDGERHYAPGPDYVEVFLARDHRDLTTVTLLHRDDREIHFTVGEWRQLVDAGNAQIAAAEMTR